MTRTAISRPCCRIDDAASPDIAVVMVFAMSVAVTPKREARWGSMLKVTAGPLTIDRKSTRLNSSHLVISYAVFCLKKKKKISLAIHIYKKKKNRKN